MPVPVVCQQCGRRLTVPDSAVGRTAQCPNCTAVFTVPVAAPTPPPPNISSSEPPAPPRSDTGVKASPGMPPVPKAVKPPPVPPAKAAPGKRPTGVTPAAPSGRTKTSAARPGPDRESSDDALIARPPTPRRKSKKVLLWGLLVLLALGGGAVAAFMLLNGSRDEPVVAKGSTEPKDPGKGITVPPPGEAPKDKTQEPGEKTEPPPPKKTDDAKKTDEGKKTTDPKVDPTVVPEFKEKPSVTQVVQVKQPPKFDLPRSSVTDAPDGWKTIQCSEGGIEVQVPGIPTPGRFPFERDTLTGAAYLVKSGALTFHVLAVQLRDTEAKEGADVTIYHFIKYFNRRAFSIGTSDPRVKSGEHSGREFLRDLENKEEGKVLARVFRVGERGICLAVTAPSPDGNDPNVKRFFDSLKINKDIQEYHEWTSRPQYTVKSGRRELKRLMPSRDGKTLYSAWWRGAITAWNTSDWSDKQIVPDLADTKNDQLYTAALAPDEKTIVRALNGHRLELVDLATGKSEFFTDTSEKKYMLFGVGVLEFSRDGKWLLSHAKGVGVKIWDVEKRTLHRYLAGSENTNGAAFSGDGAVVVTAGSDSNRMSFWDVESGKEVLSRPGYEGQSFIPPEAKHVALSPDGKRVALSWGDHTLRVWAMDSRKQRPPVPWVGGHPGKVAFASDSRLVAVGCGDGVVRFIDILSVQLRGRGRYANLFTPSDLAFSPDDKRLYVAAGDDLHVFELDKVGLATIDLAKVVPDPAPDPVVVAKKDPDKKDPPKNDPPKKDPDKKEPPAKGKDKKGDAGAAQTLQIVAKVEAFLGVVVDPDANAALLLLPNAQAKLYAYPDFKPQGTFKLAGSTYHPVYDKDKGLLYAITANLKAKDPPGKRGGSQITIYDVRPLLAGKVKPKSDVVPQGHVVLPGYCTDLLLSNDGKWLFALQHKESKNVKLVRIDVEKREVDGTVELLDFTDVLCLSRDGKAIYAASHLIPRSLSKGPAKGAIQVIDPVGMKLDKKIAIDFDPHEMDVTRDGLAFLVSHGSLRSDILVYDLAQEAPAALWKGIPANACVRLCPEEKNLYVSSWSSKLASVAALPIPNILKGSDLPRVNWLTAPPANVRGELHVTPDGTHLLCDSGTILSVTAR